MNFEGFMFHSLEILEAKKKQDVWGVCDISPPMVTVTVRIEEYLQGWFVSDNPHSLLCPPQGLKETELGKLSQWLRSQSTNVKDYTLAGDR